MKWFETENTVRFNEVDDSGIAWYGHYLAWVENGRIGLLEKFHLLPRQVESLGYLCPVVKTICEYKQAAFSGDPLIVRIRVERPQKTALRFSFEVLHKENQKVISKGEITQVFLTIQKEKINDLKGELENRVHLLVDCFSPKKNAST